MPEKNSSQKSSAPPKTTEADKGKKQNPIIKLINFFLNPSVIPFLIIGGVNTIISMAGSFALREYAGWGLFPATAIMFAATSVPGFYFNRKFSFKSKAPLGKSVLRFSVLVTGCYLLSFSINNLFMPWARQHIFPAMSNTVYNIITIIGIQVIFTALNYTGQRLWAFGGEEK